MTARPASAFIVCLVALLVFACAVCAATATTASPPAAAGPPVRTALPDATSVPAQPPRAVTAATISTVAGPPISGLTSVIDYQLARLGGCCIGLSVAFPGGGVVFSAGGDEMFPLASLAKLPIMLAVMDRAIDESRELRYDERLLLDIMITQSDNDAATILSGALGGGPAVQAYLDSIGFADIRIHESHWGLSQASPNQIARLLAALIGGDILDADQRTLALGLLGRVEPDQDWGVPASVPDYLRDGLRLGVKNGWYPGDEGWWINSAGFVVPADGSQPYAVAILSAYQRDLDAGIRNIESLARAVHAEYLD